MSILSGCITVEETYTFMKNGSGTSTIKIDLSELKAIMNTMGGEIEEAEPSQLAAIDFIRIKDSLLLIKGISNVQTQLDNSNFSIELYYEFTDKTSLNAAMNTIFKSKNAPYFEYNTKIFKLKHRLPTPIIDEIKTTSKPTFSQNVDYKIKISFEQNIKKVSTSSPHSISENKKQIVLKSNIHELIINPELFNTTIKLK